MKPKSGITQAELVKWGGSEVFNQALAIVNSGSVRHVEYDDNQLLVKGLIEQDDGWEMPTSFKLLAMGRIRSLCPCRQNQQYGMVCPHIVALGIALMVEEMEEEPSPPKGSAVPREMEEKSSSESKDTPSSTSTTTPTYIEVPMKPKMFGYLAGSRASLSMEVDAYYKDIDFPACSYQPKDIVYLEDKNDPLVRHVRSLDAEKAEIKALKKWGFESGYKDGDLKLYLTDPQKVLNFLGSGLPEMRRKGWRIDLSKKLMDLTDAMPSVVPVVTIKDAPGGAFDVQYTFDAMGKNVSPIEIQAALNRGDGYILHGSEVVLLDTSAIEQMHDVFRDCATSQGGAPRGWFRVKGVYAPYVKSSLNMLDSIDLDTHQAKIWHEMAEKRNQRGENARFEPVSLGKLENILRPYQKQGVYWMRFLEEAGISGLLADEMGLGKTLQTLTWLSLPRSDSFAAGKPALIVCPTSLVRNWEAEAKKFTPWLKTLVISGPERANDFKRIEKADIVITSYALLQRDFEAAYMDKTFSAVVIDEAQHIKNRNTKNSIAVKSLNSLNRLALTGTPVENSVSDVWSIFNFLMPEYLGEYEMFKFNFEDPILNGDAEVVLPRLKRKLHPFIMRRVKKLVAKDLPDKIIKVSYCPMDDESQREYVAALRKTRQQAGDIVKAKGFNASKFEILAMLMKLRQIASKAKVEAFMEQLISAIEGGHKILVFSQFVKILSVLKEELQKAGIPFCYLDGSTKDRLGECNKFNSNPKIPVFLISLMAGGTGLNLTSADMVIHYDPWWNPAVEAQATDRAHRIGQKKNVYVMKMIASGSIEEKVLALQRRKEAVINATIDTTDAAVMEKLTAADLNELLS